MKNYKLAFLLILIPCLTFGQANEKHPLDIQRENCFDISENQTTYGMINCERESANLWDKQLNEYYQILMKHLKKSEQKSLRAAQKKWIEYRDEELKFYGQFYNNMDGTMWPLIAANRRYEVIKTRALELKEYIDNLLEPGKG